MSLRDQLQEIYDQHGKLTPSLVVEEARDAEHPLHNRFEWDDAVAGESWRRHQAHELIRSVKITYRTPEPNSKQKNVRGWHAIRSEAGHVYEPAEKVVADPFTAKLVLADMEREWRTLKQRYEQFKEFWALIQKDMDGTAA